MFIFDARLKLSLMVLLAVTRLLGLHHLSWLLITLPYWLPAAYSAAKRLTIKQAARGLEAHQGRSLKRGAASQAPRSKH